MPFLPPVWPSRNRRLRARLGGRARAEAGRRRASHGLARRRVQEPGSPSSSFGEDPPGRPKLDATPLGSPSAVGCRRSALARFTYPVGVNRAWAWTCRLHVVVRQMLKNITVEDCSPQVRGNRAGMAFVAVVWPWPRAMLGPSRHGLVLEFEAARRVTRRRR